MSVRSAVEHAIDRIGAVGKSWPLLLALACLQCSILWLVEYPPLDDYPNHLYRHHILASLMKGEPTFQHYFAPDWRPVPYLMSDLLAVPLTCLIGAPLAGKLVLSAYVIGFPLCFAYFVTRVAPNGHALWPYGFLFTYNHFFAKGYVNYALGSAFLLLLAGYLASRPARELGPKQVAVMALLVLATYLSHLWPWLVAVVCVGVAALLRGRKHPSMAAKYLVVLLPSLFLFVLAANRLAGHTGRSVHLVFDTADKLRQVIGTFAAYSPRLEAALLFAPLLVLAIALCVTALRRRFSPWLLAALVLLGMALAAPRLEPYAELTRRFLWFSVLLACPAIALWPALRRGGTVISLFAAIGLVGSTALAYARISRQIGSDVALLRQMPIGQSAFAISPETLTVGLMRPYRHLAAYYGVCRDAIVPWGYTAAWHPIAQMQTPERLTQTEMRRPSAIAARAGHYQWLLVWGEHEISFQPPAGFGVWRTNSHLHIYQKQTPFSAATIGGARQSPLGVAGAHPAAARRRTQPHKAADS